MSCSQSVTSGRTSGLVSTPGCRNISLRKSFNLLTAVWAAIVAIWGTNGLPWKESLQQLCDLGLRKKCREDSARECNRVVQAGRAKHARGPMVQNFRYSVRTEAAMGKQISVTIALWLIAMLATMLVRDSGSLRILLRYFSFV